MTSRQSAGRQAKAASDSCLQPCVEFGKLCTCLTHYSVIGNCRPWPCSLYQNSQHPCTVCGSLSVQFGFTLYTGCFQIRPTNFGIRQITFVEAYFVKEPMGCVASFQCQRVLGEWMEGSRLCANNKSFCVTQLSVLIKYFTDKQKENLLYSKTKNTLTPVLNCQNGSSFLSHRNKCWNTRPLT